jgi:FMN phosphatase YigB (HAD superfamily)
VSQQEGEKSKPTALILDLGGVFCTWDDVPSSPVPIKQFRFLIGSSEWHDFESGKAEADIVYKALTKRFGFAEGALEETLRLVTSTLKRNEQLFTAVKKLKEDSDGQLRVFGASNISREMYDVLRGVISGWEIFDEVYISHALGVCKPERKFYDRVLKAAGLVAKSTVFVDDCTENVITAQCCGMRGVLFEDTCSAIQELYAIFDDPVQRGKAWLRTNAKNMWCVSNTGVEIRDQFQQLLMLHLTNDP